MDKLLNLIGLAKKAGKLEVGEEPVGAAARARHARLILIASDAADNTRRRAKHFGDAGECICLEIPAAKGELGKALGRTSCAMAALTDIGFAEAVAKKLAEADEAHYGEAARRLAIKAQRAAELKKGADDKICLVLLVEDGLDEHALARARVGPQGLALAPGVILDDGVRRVEDILRGAVILL